MTHATSISLRCHPGFISVSFLPVGGCQFPPSRATIPPAPTDVTQISAQLLSITPSKAAPIAISSRNTWARSDAESAGKLHAAWQQLFYGNDDTQRVYYPVGEDMAYIEDIGNGDVRTEGMSYGMMIAVQLDKKAEFDRIWKWAKTYMYQTDGPYKGYFAWHCSDRWKKTGTANPASDGEEWFVTALFFASARWGDGAGHLQLPAASPGHPGYDAHKDRRRQRDRHRYVRPGAQTGCLRSQSEGMPPSPTHPIICRLIMNSGHVGPIRITHSGLMPPRPAAVFFNKAANPQTGLMPDYANFDGTPATALTSTRISALTPGARFPTLPWIMPGSAPIRGRWNNPTGC